MNIVYAAVLGAAFTAYAASPAAENAAVAQTPVALSSETQAGNQAERYLCDDRTNVVGELSQNFDEKPVAVGLQGNGSLLEVFASKKTGSWTILVTLPTGVSCLTLVGDSFEVVQQPDGPRV